MLMLSRSCLQLHNLPKSFYQSMAYEEYFEGFKRRTFADGSYEDISTEYRDYGAVLRSTRRLTKDELDARERSDAHTLQNKILDKLLKEADVFKAISTELVNAAGSGGPVSRREAKDLRSSIPDIKDEIKRFTNPE